MPEREGPVWGCVEVRGVVASSGRSITPVLVLAAVSSADPAVHASIRTREGRGRPVPWGIRAAEGAPIFLSDSAFNRWPLVGPKFESESPKAGKSGASVDDREKREAGAIRLARRRERLRRLAGGLGRRGGGGAVALPGHP